MTVSVKMETKTNNRIERRELPVSKRAAVLKAITPPP
jgi:hypothetical protein